MVIDKSTGDGKALFALSGRLDTLTAPELEKALIPAFDENKDIALDLKDLIYISSAGLRVILVASKTAKSKGVSLVLTNMNDSVRDVFEVTGFSDIVTIE